MELYVLIGYFHSEKPELLGVYDSLEKLKEAEYEFASWQYDRLISIKCTLNSVDPQTIEQIGDE